MALYFNPSCTGYYTSNGNFLYKGEKWEAVVSIEEGNSGGLVFLWGDEQDKKHAPSLMFPVAAPPRDAPASEKVRVAGFNLRVAIKSLVEDWVALPDIDTQKRKELLTHGISTLYMRGEYKVHAHQLEAAKELLEETMPRIDVPISVLNKAVSNSEKFLTQLGVNDVLKSEFVYNDGIHYVEIYGSGGTYLLKAAFNDSGALMTVEITSGVIAKVLRDGSK